MRSKFTGFTKVLAVCLHSKENDYVEKYVELETFFQEFTDVSRFKKATFVFLVKQLVPSVYEASDGYKRADTYLEIIRNLFLDETDKIKEDVF